MKAPFFAVLGVCLAVSAVLVAQDPAASVAKEKALRHVVSLKFKSDATKEQITEVVAAFGDLKGKISEIKSLEWGTNVSPENHDKGFTHCFLLTFETAEARDAYLTHADHRAFGSKLVPIMEDVFVIDYWAE